MLLFGFFPHQFTNAIHLKTHNFTFELEGFQENTVLKSPICNIQFFHDTVVIPNEKK